MNALTWTFLYFNVVVLGAVLYFIYDDNRFGH